MRSIAAGSVHDGFDQMIAQGAGNRAERKDELNQKFKSTLEEARQLRSARRIILVSGLSFGEGLYRLRLLDRRSSGALLWTLSVSGMMVAGT